MDQYSPKHVERIVKMKSKHKNFVHLVGLYTYMHRAYNIKLYILASFRLQLGYPSSEVRTFTNCWRQVARRVRFCTVTSNICGFSARNFLHVFIEPRILRWLLHFFENVFTPAPAASSLHEFRPKHLLHSPLTYRGNPNIWRRVHALQLLVICYPAVSFSLSLRSKYRPLHLVSTLTSFPTATQTWTFNAIHIQWNLSNSNLYVVGSKSFRPDQLFKVTEIKQIRYFST